jgi:glutamate---cysteine ligase / carboxylate-amine ligase
VLTPGTGDGPPALDPEGLRAVFDATPPSTVGLEEEVLLVDPGSWLPVPMAADVVAAAQDPRVKTELPAAQVELATEPHDTVAGAIAELRSAREALVGTCGDAVAPVAAAVHPLVQGPSEVAPSERAQALSAEYGEVARRQLVGALQVHVAVGGADATLAVHNALRGYLPELAALAAAAPFHEGRDSGLASVRPLVSTLLPRQGVPPAIVSWEAHAEDLRWGAASGRVAEPGRWWWELRPHLGFGTLEVRVPDVQPTLAGAAAVASFAHALVLHLAEGHRAGEDLGAPPTWRIAENRWSALRHGTRGSLADLVTGEPQPTSQRLHHLIDLVEPHAAGGLDGARALVARGAVEDLRAQGVVGATPWLASVFLA